MEHIIRIYRKHTNAYFRYIPRDIVELIISYIMKSEGIPRGLKAICKVSKSTVKASNGKYTLIDKEGCPYVIAVGDKGPTIKKIESELLRASLTLENTTLRISDDGFLIIGRSVALNLETFEETLLDYGDWSTPDNSSLYICGEGIYYRDMKIYKYNRPHYSLTGQGPYCSKKISPMPVPNEIIDKINHWYNGSRDVIKFIYNANETILRGDRYIYPAYNDRFLCGCPDWIEDYAGALFYYNGFLVFDRITYEVMYLGQHEKVELKVEPHFKGIGTLKLISEFQNYVVLEQGGSVYVHRLIM